MNRRTFLQTFGALGAGLILPPTLAENAEAARRYWALGALPAAGRFDASIGWEKHMLYATALYQNGTEWELVEVPHWRNANGTYSVSAPCYRGEYRLVEIGTQALRVPLG